MNKKANTIGVILLVTAILGAIVIYTNVKPEYVEKYSQTQDYTTQVEIMIDNAFALAFRDFIKYGYSLREDGNKSEDKMKGSMVWYLNRPYPPDVNESVRGFRKLVQTKLANAVDILNQAHGHDGYTISISPDIDMNFNENTPLEELPDEIIIGVNEFIVRVEQEGKLREIDLSKEYRFDYRLWYIYKKLHEWSEEDAGGFQDEIYSMFVNRSCESRVCCCDSGTNLLDPDAIEDMELKRDEVLSVLDNSILRLNEKFAGDNIECTYEIEKERIENKNSFIRTNAQQVGGNYSFICDNICVQGGQPIDPAGGDQQYYFAIMDDFSTVPEPSRGIEGNFGQPLNATNESHTRIDARALIYNATLGLRKTKWEDLPDVNGTYDPNDPLNEQIGVNKLASGLVRITCEDKTHVLETEEAFEMFAPEIYFRFFQYYQCPLPESPEPGELDECGGSGGSSGGEVIDLCTAELCALQNLSSHAGCWTCDGDNQCVPANASGSNCPDCTACDENQACTIPINNHEVCGGWHGCGWCEGGSCVSDPNKLNNSNYVCVTRDVCLTGCGQYGSNNAPRCNWPINPGIDCDSQEPCTGAAAVGTCYQANSWNYNECHPPPLQAEECCGDEYCETGQFCCEGAGGDYCGLDCEIPGSG